CHRMVNRILEVVPQLRCRSRTRHARTQAHGVIEFLHDLPRVGPSRATAEATPAATTAGVSAVSTSLAVLGVLLRLRCVTNPQPRTRGWGWHCFLRPQNAAGIGGWSQGGEEFGLDDGSLDEEGIVEVHLEGDGPTRDQRHAHPAPVLVRRVLHHRPALQVWL